MAYIEITISKHIVEYKEYEKLNVKNNMDAAREVEKGNGTLTEENYKKRQKKRRDLVRQYVTNNFDENSKFITLTFKDTNKFDIKDVRQCNKEYKKFIKRLNYHVGKKVKYVTVIEFQDKNERGAIHYHMVSDVKYITNKKLSEIWGNGYVKINRIKHVDNLGAYVVKYMNKNTDDTRLQGLKAYNISKGLEKPYKITSWQNEELTKKLYDKYCKDEKMLVYDKRYHHEQAGEIVYRQYNYKRLQDNYK